MNTLNEAITGLSYFYLVTAANPIMELWLNCNAIYHYSMSEYYQQCQRRFRNFPVHVRDLEASEELFTSFHSGI